MERLLEYARTLPNLVGHAVPGEEAKAGHITGLYSAPVWPPDVRAREPMLGHELVDA